MKIFYIFTVLTVLLSSSFAPTASAKSNGKEGEHAKSHHFGWAEQAVNIFDDDEDEKEDHKEVDTEVDLYVEKLFYDHSDLTLYYDVGNSGSGIPDEDGDGKVDLTGKNEVYLDGDLLVSRAWSSDSNAADYLAAGGEATLAVPLYNFEEWDLGVHTVKVCVNTTEVGDESNVNNNCESKIIFKNWKAPDLAVNDVHVEVDEAGDATLHYSLSNESKVDVIPGPNGSNSITLSTEDGEEESETIQVWQNSKDWHEWLDGDSEGLHKAVPLTNVHEDELYEVRVCVDSQNTVVESNEENNCASFNFSTATQVGDDDDDDDETLADLKASNVTFTESASVEGSYYVTVDYKNSSSLTLNAKTAGGHNLATLNDDGKHSAYAWSTLSAANAAFLTAGGESKGVLAFPSPIELSDGDTVKVCVDAYDVIDETSENNNCTSESFRDDNDDPVADDDDPNDEDDEDEDEVVVEDVEDLLDFLAQFEDAKWIQILWINIQNA